MTPVVCIIGGSDSTGGSGIQADGLTVSELGGHAVSVVTTVTAQAVSGGELQNISSSLVESQLESVLTDFSVRAIKIGALGNEQTIEQVFAMLATLCLPVVVDPVLSTTRGLGLLNKSGIQALAQFVGQATLLTPNLQEAQVLLGQDIGIRQQDIESASAALSKKLGCSILLKGGHVGSENSDDCLFTEGEIFWYRSQRLPQNVRGTGCRLASAITVYLALGHHLEKAVQMAKSWLVERIRHPVAIAGTHYVSPILELRSKTSPQ